MSRFILEIIVLVISGLSGGALLKSSYTRAAGLALLAWIPVRLAVWLFPEWTINLGWNWLFWLTFAIGVVVFVCAAVYDSGNMRAIVRLIGFGLFVWAVIGGAIGMHFPNSDNAFEPINSPSAGSDPDPKPSGDCPEQYTQVAANNDGNRVIGDFATRYATATAEANNLTEGQITVLLEESGKSGQVLAAWAHAFGLHEDPNKWDQLVDGSCLSSEGITLHNQLDGVLSASGTTFEEAEAPADGYNSGVHEGTFGTSSTQGVYGDRKAIKVTLKDGTVVYIMVRCGNPVFPGKPPGIPDVPTDNPPPPPPPEEPPLTPKSGDARDYEYPPGKPRVTVTGPAETTPPKVVTQQPGGGGVVDTPTRPPGSETGVTAPGATPPRTTPPTQPNEGGSNNGTVEP